LDETGTSATDLLRRVVQSFHASSPFTMLLDPDSSDELDLPGKVVRSNKGEDTFRNFLTDLGRYPLLEADQELILARRIRKMQDLLEEQELDPDRVFTPEEQKIIKSGKKAKDRFICCNLRMVVNISKKYLSKVEHLDINDLVMEGIVGLIRAVELFDPSRGYKFSTYAYWWIKQALGRSIVTKERTIRLPVNVEENLTKIRRANTRLTQELGRAPTSEEIAIEMETTTENIDFIYGSSQRCRSLDIILTDDQGMTLSDIVPDENLAVVDESIEFLDKEALIKSMHLLMDELDPEEREVIKYKWGLEGYQQLALHEIARVLGIGREQVRKTAKSAETKIQYMVVAHNIDILEIIRDTPFKINPNAIPLHLFQPVFNVA
jgi:RNA polymerase sigma factor (sigma-70 family)